MMPQDFLRSTTPTLTDTSLLNKTGTNLEFIAEFFVVDIFIKKFWTQTIESFLHKYCKQEFFDLSLMVKMSLSNKIDMHDSLQLPWQAVCCIFSVRPPEQYNPPHFYINSYYLKCRLLISWSRCFVIWQTFFYFFVFL